VRVTLEEVEALRSGSEELKVRVRHLSRVEGRRSEGQDEEQDSEGENVRHLGVAGSRPRGVDFWCHVRLGPKDFADRAICVGGKAEVTELQLALVGNQDVLQLNVHVGIAGVVVQAGHSAGQLAEHRSQQVQIVDQHSLDERTPVGLVISVVAH